MLVDSQSAANGKDGKTPKTWPPPIGVPESMDSQETPEYFLCPITGCLMRQPAMTPDGVTYDYDAIAEWLSNKQTDPSTNQPLSVDQLCPNRTVRSNAHPNSAPSPSLLP